MTAIESAAKNGAEKVEPTAPARQNSTPTTSPAPGRAELFATVFVAGVAVILIEVLGTRIIGPVFGVSLFVWSALLTVTLGSLAIGYYAGGVLIDRMPTGRVLGFAVAGAGVLLALISAFSQPVLGACESLGPRGGPLVSATLLFAPSLIALGMVGPIAVRLATSDVSAAGHRVGAIYAISTAGSLVGSVLTAFYLIPHFETREILLAAAALLTLAGAIPLALRWRRTAMLALLVPILASGQDDAPLPKGIKLLDRSHSIYGLVEVLDDTQRGVRFLRSDHSIIGAQLVGDRSGAFSFLHLLEAVRFARPEARKLLQIGLGTGSLGAALGARGIDVDVVEIDPSVVEFAKKHFGFTTRGEIHVEDARTYLRRSSRRYDVIVHDTFTGGTTPEHLLSVEVIRRIHDLLTPGGVLVLNFPGYDHGKNAAGTWAVARTLRAVFPNMRVFRDAPPDEEPESPTNIVFFASEGDLEFRIPANAAFENPTCEQIQRSFQSWEIRAKVPEGPVVSDERNPMAALQLPAAEAHFLEMNKLLPPEVWIR